MTKFYVTSSINNVDKQKAIAPPPREMRSPNNNKRIMQPIYTKSKLELKSLAQLKKIAADAGITPEGDKRLKQSWIDAIIKHQSNIYPAAPAQAEIKFNDEFRTPWVVLVDDRMVGAFGTWAIAQRYCINKGYQIANYAEQTDFDALQVEFQEYVDEQAQAIAPEPIEVPESVVVLGETIYEMIEPIADKYAVSWRVINRGKVLGIMSMDCRCFWQVQGYEKLFGTPYECVAFLVENQQAIA